ncbi:MAG TPA: efflux RND transporter permease subunit [Candidatus Bathyarchaeia archaeon]|nr:efflux RND transporter permease subunit [Candidatus Bathyarchaeia archaeon]
MMMSDTAIKRPVTTILFTAATLIFGYFALTGMGVDLFPEVEFPTVTVSSILRGADPDIMDSDVTDVLESYINTIEGVKTIQSTSREGYSQIAVEFVLSKDIDVAAQEVRAKINVAQRELPLDLYPPVVDKFNIASQPILWIAVTSAGNYREMARYADDVLRVRLESTSGVGSVSMGGFRDREIRVWLDPKALEARGLTPVDIAGAIKANHIELPGGRVEQPDKEFVVKIEGEFKSAKELEELVITRTPGGVVRLKEVAAITDGAEDLRSIARYNGMASIGLGVMKQSGTNTVAVARAIKKAVADAAKSAPPGVTVQVAFDSSRFIENSMHDVLFDLFLGGVLTGGVMLLFLRNFRMTFISVMAIPTSIIACFMVMYAFGFTINNMTMLAMSLAIGIVIDDAIVVLENIFRHVEEDPNVSAMEASRSGASEVGLAVIAASSSIMAVFIPVAFMKGIIGRFFFQFGLSVALAVFISVVVSLTLTPMLCSRLLVHNPAHGRIFTLFENGFKAIERAYGRALDKALRHRWVTLGVAILFFAGGVGLIPFAKRQFVTQPDESRFLIRFELPTGTSIDKTDQTLRTIETLVFSQSEVDAGFAVAGRGGAGVNNGMMFVNLVGPRKREASQSDVMARVRTLIGKAVPEAVVGVDNISIVGGGQRNAQLMYIIQGPTVEDLERVTNAIMADMRQVPGFVDVDSDLRLNKPEIKVHIDRQLADDLGVDVKSIAENFSILFGGIDVAKFKEGGKRYDIRMRADPESRLSSDDLYQLMLRSSTQQLVRTPNLIQVEEGLGPNSIARYQRRRSVTLFANLEDVVLGEALSKMEEIAARHVPKDPAWGVAMAGTSEVFAESFQYLLYALAVSLLVIYVVLGSQFESFVHPFTILMSVPLAVIGGIGLLILTGNTLDIFSFIGFVMLVGIVTKNAILLVDFTNQLRDGGMERGAALRRAGPLRLRPILMTALTTIAAVIPVAMAMSEGGEQRAPMGVAVIGGMFTSTFLTLLVIPCVYTVLDDLSLLVRRKSRRIVAREAVSIRTQLDSDSEVKE